MARVERRSGILLATRSEFFQGIGARLCRTIGKRALAAGRHYDKRFIDEISPRLDFRPVNSFLLRNRKRGFQRKVADKDRDTSQHDSFDPGKVTMAPVQRRFQCLMARICGSAAELKEIEARTEFATVSLMPKTAALPAAEFDGECDAIKLAANLGNHWGFVVAE